MSLAELKTSELTYGLFAIFWCTHPPPQCCPLKIRLLLMCNLGGKSTSKEAGRSDPFFPLLLDIKGMGR